MDGTQNPAPLTGRPCVWWRYRIQQKKSTGGGTAASPGRRSTPAAPCCRSCSKTEPASASFNPTERRSSPASRRPGMAAPRGRPRPSAAACFIPSGRRLPLRRGAHLRARAALPARPVQLANLGGGRRHAGRGRVPARGMEGRPGGPRRAIRRRPRRPGERGRVGTRARGGETRRSSIVNPSARPLPRCTSWVVPATGSSSSIAAFPEGDVSRRYAGAPFSHSRHSSPTTCALGWLLQEMSH